MNITSHSLLQNGCSHLDTPFCTGHLDKSIFSFYGKHLRCIPSSCMLLHFVFFFVLKLISSRHLVHLAILCISYKRCTAIKSTAISLINYYKQRLFMSTPFLTLPTNNNRRQLIKIQWSLSLCPYICQ